MGSCVIQHLKDGCFIKVLYSSSTLIQPLWSKTKCIKALQNRAAPKHGSLNDFSHIVRIKWWTVTDYNHTTTCTWSPYLVASSALLLEILISPYPPAANGFEVWTASDPPGTAMRKSWGRDLGVPVVWTEVKHIYKSVWVEVTGEASWGLAVSYRIREHRGFCFFFSFLTSVHTRGQNGRLILQEKQYTTSTMLQHWFIFCSCHQCVSRITLALKWYIWKKSTSTNAISIM